MLDIGDIGCRRENFEVSKVAVKVQARSRKVDVEILNSDRDCK